MGGNRRFPRWLCLAVSLQLGPLRRRITRLDQGVSPEMAALDKLTDDELHAHIRNDLAMVDPALADRYSPDFSVAELHAIFVKRRRF